MSRLWYLAALFAAAASAQQFEPLSGWRKMEIAARDTVALQPYATGILSALLSQSENWNPSYGQGMAGFGRRWAVGTANRNNGYILTEGVLPVLLHEDPRYFRMGQGPAGKRIWHVIERSLVTRTDAGTRRFNTSGIAGFALSSAIANAYQPDYRTVGETLSRTGTSIGVYTLSNALTEFLPDLRRLLKRPSPHKNNGR